MLRVLCTLLLVAAMPVFALADTITISGSITQSTGDGTGPAVSNPSLNNITDLQRYTLTLSTPGAITAPGFYNLTGAMLSFAVPAAPASETYFDSIRLNVAANGAFADFNLFACIAGAECLVGNSLSASFEIPLGAIAALGVPTVGLDQPHPLDLLEDDGITDIHGTITSYSNTATPTAVTPEPSSGSLALLALLSGVFIWFARTPTFPSFRRSL